MREAELVAVLDRGAAEHGHDTDAISATQHQAGAAAEPDEVATERHGALDQALGILHGGAGLGAADRGNTLDVAVDRVLGNVNGHAGNLAASNRGPCRKASWTGSGSGFGRSISSIARTWQSKALSA